MTTLRVKRLRGQGILPGYQSNGAAGLDLPAAEGVTIPTGECRLVPTGLAVEIPCGYEGQVRGRSGLATEGIMAHVGTVDSDYRGEIMVILYNLSAKDYRIVTGMRIGQLVISRVEAVTVEMVSELSRTERGSQGFGSTG